MRKLVLIPLVIAIVEIFVPVAKAESVSYKMDSLNRLTNITYSSGGSISYAYDKGGNRILLSVIAPNRSPVAANDLLGTIQNQAVNASAAKLLANDSDPDNDALSILDVSATSTNGGSVAFNSGILIYTPVTDFIGLDRFTYTLSDGRGGLDTGTVIVTVRDANSPSLNEASITITANGKQIRFAGIPGQNYVIQSAEAVTGPWTGLSGTLTAGLTGVVEYQDNEEPPPTTRFYRIIAAP